MPYEFAPKLPAITRFERLWWGSTLVWLTGARLAWERTQGVLAGNPQSAPVAGWAQPIGVVLVLLVTAGLWFGVARRASVVAKWLVVLIAAGGALRALNIAVTLAAARHPPLLSSGAFLLATGLSIAAAVMLFRPDARLWFGEDRSEPEGEEA